MRKHPKYIILVICLLFGLFYWLFKSEKYNLQKTIHNESTIKIKSGNLATDYSIEQTIQDINDLKLNTVNVPIVINIEDIKSSDMEIDEYSVSKATELIEKLNKKEITVILEPYPWLANGSQYETEWNPDDKEEFFFHWENNVLKPLIEEVLNPYEVEIFNIGTGFNYMEEFEEQWLDIIQSVRSEYDGLLTYRTSWWKTAEWEEESQKNYRQKLNNQLFSEIDFISIAAYFELTEAEKNTIPELIDALHSTKIYNRKQNVLLEIEEFHKKWDKPIFFGELGFPKTTYSSQHPWDPYASEIIDPEEQANGFAAYQDVFNRKDWFIGFSVFSIGENSDEKLYYPSEETKEIIRKWN